MSAGKIGAVLERQYVTKSTETTKTVFHSNVEEFIIHIKSRFIWLFNHREKNIHVFIFQVFASAAVISLNTWKCFSLCFTVLTGLNCLQHMAHDSWNLQHVTNISWPSLSVSPLQSLFPEAIYVFLEKLKLKSQIIPSCGQCDQSFIT